LLKIQKVSTYLEAKGRSKNTCNGFEKHIKQIAKRASLDNPAEVELAIARYKCVDPTTRQQTSRPASNCYKDKLIHIYDHYRKFYGLNWTNSEKPIYRPEEHGIQPPTEEKIRMLISSARGALSLRIDISMQTGLRPIEVQGYKGLRVKDIHTDTRTIIALNTKGCTARPPMLISQELNARLSKYITEKRLTAEEFLFKGEAERYGEHFRRMRNRLAKKLNDPSIKAIRLYDLRHYYITKQLRRTQNCEIVRQIVGHKRLDTTQKYFHLLAGTNSGEWIVEGTTDKERAKQLLAADFTYQLTTPDGTMLFKKAK
jgi:site-specific recombinase XerD